MSILLACVALYVLALAAVALGQRRLLYFPYARAMAPASAGLAQAEVLHLQTEDGETLLAWFVAPSPGRPLILYFHGNAEGLAARGLRFEKLTETGDGLLAVEYRGYPGSTGRPSEKGLLRDGEATYVKALALGVPPARIVAMGESLGSGVAVDLGRDARLARWSSTPPIPPSSTSRRRFSGCFRCGGCYAISSVPTRKSARSARRR